MHCKNEPSEAVHTPQLSRFVAANSDPEAIMIADAAIEACGGTEAWNAVKGLKWNFSAEGGFSGIKKINMSGSTILKMIPNYCSTSKQ